MSCCSIAACCGLDIYSIKFNDSILVNGVLVLMSSVHLMQIGDGYGAPAISASLS